MRSWVALAACCALAVAIATVYEFGATSAGAANAVGILVVLFGLVVAGLVLSRTRPP